MDWVQLIQDMRDRNLTLADIASEAGPCSPSAINELAKGRTKEPQWPLGDRLIRLHALICKSSVRREAA